MQARIAELAADVLGGRLLDRDAGAYLAGVSGDDVYDLFYWANRIRIHFMGRDVRFCAIVAAKMGGCSEDCKFCAQSGEHNTPASAPTTLGAQQILQSASHAAEVGADSFGIVNSGRGPTRHELEEWLKPLMIRIASEGRTRACATLGTLTPQTAKFLYDCGIRRINHNIETSQRFYPSIVTTHPFSERIRTLKIAKEAGLEVCSGGIFGMGETWDDRVDMMLTLRDVGIDVMPINFLNAIAGTALEGTPRLHPMECLKIISIARFMLPDKHLKVAGGREVCLRDLQSWIFFAGADSTMIGNYLTTYGRSPEMDHQMVLDLGLKWSRYEGGPMPTPAEGNDQTGGGAVICRTGKHGIPILYEREGIGAVAEPHA